ncbi:MAG: DMT family transporter [Enhygromyxa sp.]
MIGLALASACALAWAGLDVLRKQLGQAIAPLPLLVLLNVGLLPVFGLWWLVSGGTISDPAAYAPPAGAALVLQVVANILFLAAVRASPLSLTIPFLALTPVFATAIGAALLGERPAPVQLLGVALVVAGALGLSSVGAPRDVSRDVPEGRSRAGSPKPAGTTGIPMMIGVAACWGVTMALDKRALEYAAVPIHALIQLLGVVLTALVYLLLAGRRGELRRGREQLPRLVFATLLGAAALGLQLVAVQLILVSQLETLKRALGLIGAVVFGRLVFGEPITARKIAAILLMVAGVVLLMLRSSS